MNETITIGRLADIIAESTATDTELANRFLNAFTSVVEKALQERETVKIKGIGTFRRLTSGTQAVGFIPDRELAAQLNSPFSFFDTIELDDDVTESMIEAEAAAEQTGGQPAQVSQPDADEAEHQPDAVADLEPEGRTEAETETEAEAVVSEVETEPEPEAEPEELPEPEAEPAEDSNEESSEPEAVAEATEQPATPDVEAEHASPAAVSDASYQRGYGIHRHRRRRHPFSCAFFCIGLVCGIIIGSMVTYLSYNHLRNFINSDTALLAKPDGIVPEHTVAESVQTVDTVAKAVDTVSVIAATDSVAKVKTDQSEAKAVSAEPVYDTVSSTRFLTTMAREHYGVMDFWVYIYDENSAKLKNPNRIKPGTRVVIPPVEKYSKSTDPEVNLAAARRRAAEIYSRY